MSAFLGPIHFWLYNKIKIQNEVVEEIFSSTVGKKLNIRERAYELYGDGDMLPLDEIIDVSNIHGWLQERVTIVENKLAYAVSELLKESDENIIILKKIFYDKGLEVSDLDNNSDAKDAIKNINDTLLDGMPCDHANVILVQEEDEVVWRRETCVHQKYWIDKNLDVSIYYMLRDEFIKGLLVKTIINYEKTDERTGRLWRR